MMSSGLSGSTADDNEDDRGNCDEDHYQRHGRDRMKYASTATNSAAGNSKQPVIPSKQPTTAAADTVLRTVCREPIRPFSRPGCDDRTFIPRECVGIIETTTQRKKASRFRRRSTKAACRLRVSCHRRTQSPSKRRCYATSSNGSPLKRPIKSRRNCLFTIWMKMRSC